MNSEIKCNNCGHIFVVGDVLEGQDIVCPNCKTTIYNPIYSKVEADASENNVRICPKCGCELLKDALFCVKCGTKVTKEKEPSKKTLATIKAFSMKDWQAPVPKLNKFYWWLRFVFVLLVGILSIIGIICFIHESYIYNYLDISNLFPLLIILILCILSFVFMMTQHKKRKTFTKKELFIRFSAIISIFLALILLPVSRSSYKKYKDYKRRAKEKARIQKLLYDEGLGDNDYLIHEYNFFGCLERANQGDSIAQYVLGEYYYNGQYVQKNYEKAYAWFLKASQTRLTANSSWIQQGFNGYYISEVGAKAGALFYLGLFYNNGYYAKKDIEQAIKYYQQAADLGNETAMFNLGILYFHGNDVTKDDKIAFDYFYDSSEKNYPRAQYMLGLFYLDGIGTTKNIKSAVKWLTKAAERGDAFAQGTLGDLYLRGEGVAKDIDKAKELLNKAAQGGDKVAKRKLRELNDNE